jgi:hypothetical protein
MTTLRVPFLSADYFTLADSRSELGDAFALGQNVIIVVDGIAYEVVGAEDSGDRIVIPEAQVEEDETITDNETDEFVAPSEILENAKSICPGFSLLVGLSFFPVWMGYRRKKI